jgi:hypothetical protein
MSPFIICAHTPSHADASLLQEIWNALSPVWDIIYGVLTFIAVIVTVLLGAMQWRSRRAKANPWAFTPSTERALDAALNNIRFYNEVDVSNIEVRDIAPFISGQTFTVACPLGTSTFIADSQDTLGNRLMKEVQSFGATVLSGATGSGKSYALGLLAQALYVSGQAFAFIDASTWSSGDYSSFVGWLRTVVSDQYHISSEHAVELLLTGRLVLLLDDADEGDPQSVQHNLAALQREQENVTGLRFCATQHPGREPSVGQALSARSIIAVDAFEPTTVSAYLRALGAEEATAERLAEHQALCSPLVLSRVAAGTPTIDALTQLVEASDTTRFVRDAVWSAAIEYASNDLEGRGPEQVRRGLRWLSHAIDVSAAEGSVFELGRLTPECLPTRNSRLMARRLIALWVLPSWLVFQGGIQLFQGWSAAGWIAAFLSWGITAVIYYFAYALPISERRAVPGLVAVHWWSLVGVKPLSLLRLGAVSIIAGALVGGILGALVGLLQRVVGMDDQLLRETILWTVVLLALFAVGRRSGAILAAVAAAAALGIATTVGSGAAVGLLAGIAVHLVSSLSDTLEVTKAPSQGADPRRALIGSWKHNAAFDVAKWFLIGLTAAGIALCFSAGNVSFALGAGVAGAFLYGFVVSGIPAFNYATSNRLLRRNGDISGDLAGFLDFLVAARLVARTGAGFAYELAHKDMAIYLEESEGSLV